MIKVLVTGSSGQLGRCLQDVAMRNTNIDWYFKNSSRLDISNREALDIIFGENNFDYIVNCAAYTAVDKAETEVEKAFLVNAEAVKNIAKVCKIHHVTLIHISTDFVFNGNKEIPYTEEDTPNPINVYGTSKLKGEEHIQAILKNYFIIRTSWVYSEYGNNFVKTMLRLGKEREELSVVNNQFGSPTYAGDLAEVLLKIIKSDSKEYGVFHYSNEGIISWYDFARAIFTHSKTKIKLNPIKTEAYPRLAIRPSFSVLNKEKIRGVLTTEIRDWKESLIKCLNDS